MATAKLFCCFTRTKKNNGKRSEISPPSTPTERAGTRLETDSEKLWQTAPPAPHSYQEQGTPTAHRLNQCRHHDPDATERIDMDNGSNDSDNRTHAACNSTPSPKVPGKIDLSAALAVSSSSTYSADSVLQMSTPITLRTLPESATICATTPLSSKTNDTLNYSNDTVMLDNSVTTKSTEMESTQQQDTFRTQETGNNEPKEGEQTAVIAASVLATAYVDANAAQDASEHRLAETRLNAATVACDNAPAASSSELGPVVAPQGNGDTTQAIDGAASVEATATATLSGSDNDDVNVVAVEVSSAPTSAMADVATITITMATATTTSSSPLSVISSPHPALPSSLTTDAQPQAEPSQTAQTGVLQPLQPVAVVPPPVPAAASAITSVARVNHPRLLTPNGYQMAPSPHAGYREFLSLHGFPASEDSAVQILPPCLMENANQTRTLLPALHPNNVGKKCLVLDLDETLVHSSFTVVDGADFVIPIQLDAYTQNVYVQKRPGVDEFLARISEYYEIVVFTASLAAYADAVLDLLDPHRYVHHRLFRDSCVMFLGSYVKNLSVLGRDVQNIAIVDNSHFSYAFHVRNAVPILSWFDDPEDIELERLGNVLLEMAEAPNVPDFLFEKRRDGLLPPA